MISGLMSSAISGVLLNGSRLSASADNIANVSTTAYRSTSIHATTQVTGQTSTTQYSAGGVTGRSRPSVDVQGALQATTRQTDLALAGDGFFTVAKSVGSNEVFYTRDGSFAPDSQGYLVNASGAYLLSNAVDSNGNVSQNLSALNVSRLSGTASASTQIDVAANLPADAAVGETFNVSAGVYDAQGNRHELNLTFEKKSNQTFTLTINNPVLASDGTVSGVAEEGGVGGGSYQVDVVFGSDGTLSGFDANQDGTVDSATAPNLSLSGLSTGAGALDISLDLGTSGSPNGLTSYAGGYVVQSVNTDGAQFGNLSGVSIAQNGQVDVQFSNGSRQTVGKIPVATFTNPNGLEALSGNLYQETDASGAPTLRTAGTQGAGQINAASLEYSNVDLGREFAEMILSENAYKASLRAFSAIEDLTQELVNLKS